MVSVQEGDLVVVLPVTILGQRVLGSTQFWDGLDELSVDQPKKVKFNGTGQARITSVSYGRATAVPHMTSSKNGIKAGDKLTFTLSTYIDNNPGVKDTPPGLTEIRVPEATLGDTVTVLVYQIRNDIAFATPDKIIESGFSVGDRVSAKVKRLSEKAQLDQDNFDSVSIDLEKPVVIGGNATVELTDVDGGLSGKIVDLDFIPQAGEQYQMSVERGSDSAKPKWDNFRGVETIDLRNESLASGEATIEITRIGNRFKGQIVDYVEPLAPGDQVRAVVTKNRREAQSISPECDLMLDEVADLDGEAVVEVHDEIKVDDGITPPRATLLSYDALPSEGETINARIAGNRRVAYTYGDEYRIDLSQRASDTGFGKIKITRVDRTDLEGRVVQSGFEGESKDDDATKKNPFAGNSTSRNTDITGKKL